MAQSRTALVLGATGGIGGEMARNLKARGWTVRALSRDPAAVAGRDGLDWRRGDAMNPVEVAAAAEGVGLIVHGVNPPGYRNWGTLVLPMLASSIAAARSAGARILCRARSTTTGRTPGRCCARMRRSIPRRARARSGSRWSGGWRKRRRAGSGC